MLLCLLTLLLLIQGATFAETEPEIVVELMRHGARAPLHLMPNAELQHSWQAQPGELLPLGMAESYRLGEKSRNELLGFGIIPIGYSPVFLQKIKFFSTDVNRTLQTAQAFGLGLYPPGTGLNELPEQITPIPIHTVDLLYPIAKRTTDKVMANIIRISQDNTSACGLGLRRAQQSGDIKRWSEISGFNLSKPLDFVSFADNIVVRTRLSIPLPSKFTNTDQENILQLANICFADIAKNPAFANVYARPLLRHIIEQLESKKKHNVASYYFYAIHDTNISAIMTLLGKPMSSMPEFNSQIQIQLYREPGTESHIVQFIVSKSPIELSREICGTKTISCPFEKFKHYITKE